MPIYAPTLPPAPNYFDDIPAGTTKLPFEFLNNFSVTTNRAIKPL